MKRIFNISVCTMFLAFAGQAHAQDGKTCDVAAPLDGQRLLRRLSLDLRGDVPSRTEAEAQAGKADVAMSTIDDYLASPEFIRTMRKMHETQLWPNIDQVSVIPDTNLLYAYEVAPGDFLYFSFLRAVFVRPAPGGDLYYPCKNEPARFDGQGHIIADPVMINGNTVAYQEGYVMVEPYWAPGTQIKVCGFDAQENMQGTFCPGPVERYPFPESFCESLVPYGQATGTPVRNATVDCNGPLQIFAPDCGCGPNLEFCHTYETVVELRQNLLEEEMRLVDKIISSDRPYHEILTDKTIDINGVVAHYLRYQSRLDFDLFGDPDADFVAPNIPYTDKTWRPVTRTGRHSGLLTAPGYLLRFQTNRGRAHRFYEAFECSAFIPNGPLPSPFEECSQHQDLTKRCGCNACHQILEPMAAHWGRFAEYGFTQIDDTKYPAMLGPSCTPPFDNLEKLFRCFRFYKTEVIGEEVPYQYMLNSYVFRTPDQVDNIEQGPSKLAQASIDSGRFTTCTARKMWTQLMRRQPTTEEETNVLPKIIDDYEKSGFKLKTLIKSIVSHPAYRRLP